MPVSFGTFLVTRTWDLHFELAPRAPRLPAVRAGARTAPRPAPPPAALCWARALSRPIFSTTGGIRGTLTPFFFTPLTNTTTTVILTTNNLTAISGRVAIQADAELLSSDTSNPHHVIIASAFVQTDGTFTIYPLQSNSKTPTVYDVVIHGPNIATIIIKNVSVATTTPSLAPMRPRRLVRLRRPPRAVRSRSALSFRRRRRTRFRRKSLRRPPHPCRAVRRSPSIRRYLLPGKCHITPSHEVGIDPINGNLQTPEVLSLGAIQSGTYASSGSTITVTSSTPAEGPSKYRVSAIATSVHGWRAFVGRGRRRNYGPSAYHASYGHRVSSPPQDGSAAATLTAAVITESSPGTYTGGELLVSRNGAVIGTAVIPSSALLTGSGSAMVSGSPSGSGNYYPFRRFCGAPTAFNYEKYCCVTGDRQRWYHHAGVIAVALN